MAPMSPPPCTLFWPRSGLTPDPYLPDVPGEQRQVDEREHVVDRVVMLGDAQGPADHGTIGTGIGVCRVANDVGRDPGLPLPRLQACSARRRGVFVETGGRPLNERLIREARVDDFPRHRVGQRDVAPDVEAQPLVGPLRGGGSPGIHDDIWAPAVDRLEDVMEEDRVIFPGVRAPQKDDVRLFHLSVGARAPTGTEHRRQTDDARSVSRSVAAVDVVGAEADPHQLLREVVHLVAGLRAAESADGIATVPGLGALEAFRGAIQRLLPRGRAQLARSRTSGSVRRVYFMAIGRFS